VALFDLSGVINEVRGVRAGSRLGGLGGGAMRVGELEVCLRDRGSRARRNG